MERVNMMGLLRMFVYTDHNHGKLDMYTIALLEIIESDPMLNPQYPEELDACLDSIVLLGRRGEEIEIINEQLELNDLENYRVGDAFQMVLNELSQDQLANLALEIIPDLRMSDKNRYYKVV